MDFLSGAVSIGLGLLGASGQASANRVNRDIAREQMRFQERMSSTAAQRAVKDYEAAGLNPALAYGQTASSPGGAGTSVGNVAEAGISSALSAQRQREEIKALREQTLADIELKKSTAAKARAEGATAVAHGDLLHAQRQETLRSTAFQRELQPHMLNSAAANALLSTYALPGAKNMADLQARLGEWAPALSYIGGSAKAAASIASALSPLRMGAKLTRRAPTLLKSLNKSK